MAASGAIRPLGGMLVLLLAGAPAATAGAARAADVGLPLARALVALPQAGLPPGLKRSRGLSGRGDVGRGTSDRGTSGREREDSEDDSETAISNTSPTLTTWDLWWNFNQDDFLWPGSTGLRGGGPIEEWSEEGWAPPETPTTLAGDGRLTGRGQQSDPGPVSAVRRLARGEIVPVLQAVLESSDEEPLTSTALIALCRASAHDPTLDVARDVMTYLADEKLPVQVAAAFGLGLLGSRDGVSALVEIARASPGGRRYAGGQVLPWQLRVAAILAIGYADDRYGVMPLLDVLEKEGDSDERIGPGTVVALGLMDNDWAVRAGDALLSRFAVGRSEPGVLESVAVSLGRLGHAQALDTLAASALDRDSRRIVRQSATVALGGVGRVDDTVVIDALNELVDKAKDESVRHFAWMSLARVGARDEHAADHAEQHERLATILLKQLRNPRLSLDRPWAALAAGLYGRAQPQVMPRFIEPLRKAYADVADPAQRGAFVLALGLAGDTKSAPALLHDFHESHTVGFKGQVALALGLMGADEARATLRAEAQVKGVDPELMPSLAIALRLLGDTDAVPMLREAYRTATTATELILYADALGVLGHPSAVPELAEVAQDEGLDPSIRAAACEALARIAEGASAPWPARLSIDSNYVEGIASLDDLFEGT